LTHSWNENRSAINTVSPEFSETLLFKNEPVADIATMAEFRAQIKNIERINAEWRAPRLGLKASITLEKDLKQRYCQRFYEHFDADINKQIEEQIADGGWDKNNAEPAVRYIPFIARRVNLLNALFKGAGEQQLAQLPDPDYALMILNDDKRSPASDTLDSYKETYITYLIWQKDRVVLNKTMAGMQRLLANYFSESQGDLGWLTEWANRHLRGQAVTMNSFWRGTAPDDGLASVKPAYTLEGRKLIGHFVTDELDAAVAHSLSIVQQKESFVASYQDAYYGAWLALGAQFEKGMSLFKEDTERLSALERLASENSPYMQLIQKMAVELFPIGSEDTWPTLHLLASHEEKYNAWLTALRNFSVVRHTAIGDAATDNKAVKQLGNKIAGKVRGNTAVAAKLVLGTLDDSKLAKAREAFMQYQKAMAGFTGITTSLGYAHQVALSGFGDNPAEAKSHLYAADRASASLRSMLSQQDVPCKDPIKDPFWCLFQEPLDALWRFTVLQAGCRLQELWDEEVIVRTQGVHDQYHLTTLLFGDRGLADQYMFTHARPFVLQSSARGYHARERQNVRVPFQRSFFDFIRQGKRWNSRSGGVSQQQNFNVTVTAYPTDVNAEARIKPYMTRLMVDSPVGAAVLENKQYPVEKKFHWSAARDGSVVLQIHFENITLTQRYTGYCAFGKFLRDFSGGRKTFTADQFPNQVTDLKRFGVKQIDVIFQFDQSQIQPVMRLLDTGPGQPPRKIINCKKIAG
jgi:type VI secretion system protein ImpL